MLKDFYNDFIKSINTYLKEDFNSDKFFEENESSLKIMKTDVFSFLVPVDINYIKDNADWFLKLPFKKNIQANLDKLENCNFKEEIYLLDFLYFLNNINDKDIDKVLDMLYTYLVNQIKKHNYNYYVLHKSIISDFEYDFLVERLKIIGAHLGRPVTVEKNELSSLIEDYECEPNKKIKHKVLLRSISAFYNIDKLLTFNQKIHNKLLIEGDKEIDFILEPKIDGISVIIEYENGELVSCLSRGDFNYGENITKYIKLLPDIPKTLPEKYNVIVRGELYMTLTNFNKMNSLLKANESELFSNPRNAVRSSIKLLNLQEFKSRNLNLLVYDCLRSDRAFNNDVEFLQWLKSSGFRTFDESLYVKNFNVVDTDIEYLTDKYYEFCKKLDGPMDGLVIKVSNYFLRMKLGVNYYNYNWCYAFKLKRARVKTKLLDIKYELSIKGVVSPVGILEPVKIKDLIVKNVNLYNCKYIDRIGLHYDDYVYIEMASDVIPCLSGISYDDRSKDSEKIDLLEFCPSCRHPLSVNENGFLFCNNARRCKDQIVKRILRFISKSGMNITKVGDKIIDILVANGIIRDCADLYSINYEKCLTLKYIGKKKIENLKREIEKSRDRNLENVICALGIHRVGLALASKLARSYKTLDAFMTCTRSELRLINRISKNTTYEIIRYLRDPYNIKQLKRLKGELNI